MTNSTSKENLALDLILGRLGESRYNRSQEAYAALADMLPPLKVLHGWVNDKLKEFADAGFKPYQICYFKAGDRYPWYDDFPTSLSLETIRNALVKTGFREKQTRKARKRSDS